MDYRPKVMQPWAMRARRLEDRIRELCARALRAQDSELGSVLSALQSALREHNDRLRKLAAAKLSGWRVRGTGIPAPRPALRATFECVLCSKSIPLEDSKVDEDGRPMHEECYVAKLILSKPALQPQAD
jgi:hypothetical protein